MTLAPETLAVIADLIEDEARRVRLARACPAIALADAEAILDACRCADLSKGRRAFRAAVAALQVNERRAA